MQNINLLIYLFFFIFGLIVGSFLNCVIWRLDSKKTFLSGRSACTKCKHKLSFGDLIPILSFIILKGKCRYCKEKISWQYPLVELAAGILFVLTIHSLQFTTYNFKEIFAVSYWLFVVSSLLIIFVYDFKHYIIPDKVLFPAIFITVLYRLLEVFQRANWNFSDLGLKALHLITNYLFSGLGAAAFFLIIFLLSKGRWIGFGDVKLGILLGLLLGWPKILTAMFIAYLIGGIISTGLIVFKKMGLKSEVPFAPFLIAGTFFALFWGDILFNWYWNLII